MRYHVNRIHVSGYEAAGTAVVCAFRFPLALRRRKGSPGVPGQPAPCDVRNRPHQLSQTGNAIPTRLPSRNISQTPRHEPFAHPLYCPPASAPQPFPPGKHPRYVSATALCAPITALCALGFTGRGKLRTTPGVSPRLSLRARGCHTRCPSRGACDYTYHVYRAITRGWREHDG